HIGESLMPYCYFPLERIGVVEKIKASHFPKKYSVQFVSPNGKVSAPFYFFQHLEHEAATTWQVLRSEFDQILLDNAREKGAEVREETTVVSLLEESGRVIGVRSRNVAGEIQEHHAPITLDCSGKESFAAVREGWRMKDPRL